MLLLSVISMRHAASRNGMFCAVTWPVSARQTARIEMQNGTFCNTLSGRGLAEKGVAGGFYGKMLTTVCAFQPACLVWAVC